MVEAYDLVLSHSLVAADGGAAVGLANLGLRDERAWVGGVGVVPAHRGAGIGRALMRALLANARDLGAGEMALEVITENAPAIALYEQLGFRTTRELEVLSLARADSEGEAEEVGAAAALRLIARRSRASEPWQRDDATLANLARCDRPPGGLAAGEAAAVYREEGGRVALLRAAGDPAGLRTLLAVLRRRGQVSAVNYPIGSAATAALREAGAEVVLRQFEMSISL